MVTPGDETEYRAAAVLSRGCIRRSVRQLSYGHAVLQAREFVAGQAFLHLVAITFIARDQTTQPSVAIWLARGCGVRSSTNS